MQPTHSTELGLKILRNNHRAAKGHCSAGNCNLHTAQSYRIKVLWECSQNVTVALVNATYTQHGARVKDLEKHSQRVTAVLVNANCTQYRVIGLKI